MTTFRTADGLTLAYRLAGDGPLLVCQPGGPGRRASYLGDLGGLAGGRTLLLLDPRGTGDSERPADPERLQAQHVAADLEALREHLGVVSFDLLAHSAGCVAAQLYAAAHPAALRRLVLVTPSGRLQGVAAPDAEDIVRRRAAAEPHLADAAAAAARGESGAAIRPLLYGPWNAATQAHAAGTDAEMDRVAERYFRPPPGAVDEAAVVAALRDVTARVLVVAGEDDALTGVEGARAVAESFADARLEVLPGCGHYPWVELPQKFAELVDAFLR